MKRSLTIKIIVAVCLILGMMLTVCACDTSDNNETESKTPTTAPTTAPTEEPTAKETETEEPGYKFTVVDENGAPLEGVFLQICCGDLCLAPYWTDANGKVVLDQDLTDYTAKAYLDGYTSEQAEYAFENGSTSIKIVMTKN